MAAVSTAGMTISYGGNAITGVGSISVSSSRSLIEITEFADSRQKFISGNATATASIEIFYDQSITGVTNFENAVNAATAAVSVVVTLHSGATYTGDGFATSISITGSPNEIVRATLEIQFTGTVTIA
jgi:hypothetical protein